MKNPVWRLGLDLRGFLVGCEDPCRSALFRFVGDIFLCGRRAALWEGWGVSGCSAVGTVSAAGSARIRVGMACPASPVGFASDAGVGSRNAVRAVSTAALGLLVRRGCQAVPVAVRKVPVGTSSHAGVSFSQSGVQAPPPEQSSVRTSLQPTRAWQQRPSKLVALHRELQGFP